MTNRLSKILAPPQQHTDEPDPNWERTPTGWRHKTRGWTVDYLPAPLQAPDFDTSHCPTVGSERPLVPLDSRPAESPFDYLAVCMMGVVLFWVAVVEVVRCWRGE